MHKQSIAILAQPFDGVLPPQQNSIGIYSYEIAQQLSDQYDVHILIPHVNGHEKMKHVNGGHFHYLSIKPDYYLQQIYKKVFGHDALNDFSHRFYYFAYVLQAALVIRKYNCKIVHTYNFSQFPKLLKRINPNLKTLVNMRCEWLSQLPQKQIAQQLTHVDAIVGCSQYIAAKAANRFPESHSKFSTIHIGFDTNRLSYNPDIADRENNTVLFVGRLSPEKGVHTLIEAFAIAKRSKPSLKLCLVGSHGRLGAHMLVDLSDDPLVLALKRFYKTDSQSEYMDFLRNLITSYDLDDSVEIVGPVTHKEVVAFQSKALTLVNPSLSEAFGRSPVEAMCIGLPTILTQIGGHPELAGKEQSCGLLVDPEQPEEMATAILKLSEDRLLRIKLAKAGRQHAEQNFSWDKTCDNLTALYQTMLS